MIRATGDSPPLQAPPGLHLDKKYISGCRAWRIVKSSVPLHQPDRNKMRAFLFFALVLFSSPCLVASAADASIIIPAALQSCLAQAGATPNGSTTITPDNALYNQTASTLVFNLQFSDRHPVAIVMVRDEDQITKVLSCARKFNCRAVVRNGGHSFEGRKKKLDIE